MASSATTRRPNRQYIYLPLPLLATVFLLFGAPPSVSSFGQGVQIQNNFGVYCNRPTSQRYPIHADVFTCRGLCRPRGDVRHLFNITVNATTYFRDSIEVSIRANPGFGAYAVIRGFAVIAMKDESIVGSFTQQPDALIASCDPLLEGHTAFHSFANPSRSALTLRWSSDSKNFGRIRFRAWIVVRHNDVYVLDSEYVLNELTGANQLALEDNFFGVVLNVLNISREVVEVVHNDKVQTSAPQVISNSSTASSASSQTTPGSVSAQALSSTGGAQAAPTSGTTSGSLVRRENIVTTSSSNIDSSSSSSNKDDDKNGDNIEEAAILTISVPMPGGKKMQLEIPTLRAFQDMFERRLMTTGFDPDSSTPFEKVTRAVPLFQDLFPEPPPSPSTILAPFATHSNSPFFQSFGGGSQQNDVINIIQSGSSLSRMLLNGFNRFPGQGSNPNPFVSGVPNQFWQQNFGGNALGFPTNNGAFERGNTNGNPNPFVSGVPNQFGQPNFGGNALGFPTNNGAFIWSDTNGQMSTSSFTNPFLQAFPNGVGSSATANPFINVNSQQSQVQLGFPNVGSSFQRLPQSPTAGLFSQSFGQNTGFSTSAGSGGFGQQFSSSSTTNPFFLQQASFGQQNPQGNAFTQQQVPGSLFAHFNNPWAGLSNPLAQQQNFAGGFNGGQSQFPNSQFGQLPASQLGFAGG